MKARYDKKTVSRVFVPGDQVLVLLPMTGSSLSAQFSGPYTVEKRISDTNYMVKTPERRRSSRICHVNMLKEYLERDSTPSLNRLALPESTGRVAGMLVAGAGSEDDADDGLTERRAHMKCERLCNSDTLKVLPTVMLHLDRKKQATLIHLIHASSKTFEAAQRYWNTTLM